MSPHLNHILPLILITALPPLQKVLVVYTILRCYNGVWAKNKIITQCDAVPTSFHWCMFLVWSFKHQASETNYQWICFGAVLHGGSDDILVNRNISESWAATWLALSRSRLSVLSFLCSPDVKLHDTPQICLSSAQLAISARLFLGCRKQSPDGEIWLERQLFLFVEFFSTTFEGGTAGVPGDRLRAAHLL